MNFQISHLNKNKSNITKGLYFPFVKLTRSFNSLISYFYLSCILVNLSCSLLIFFCSYFYLPIFYWFLFGYWLHIEYLINVDSLGFIDLLIMLGYLVSVSVDVSVDVDSGVGVMMGILLWGVCFVVGYCCYWRYKRECFRVVKWLGLTGMMWLWVWRMALYLNSILLW